VAEPFLTDAAIMGSSPEASDIQRQRKLADLLTANAFNQPQGQMISGHYVPPSWTQQLAPLVSGLSGSMLGSNIDKKQEALAQQLRGKQEAEIEKYASLQNDPASQLRFGMSATNPLLKDLVKKRLEGTKLAKEETLFRENIGGQNTTLEGKPDLPEAIKYAISIGQLPQDPRTWTAQQAALAEQINIRKANASANKFDFSNMLGKGNIGEISPMLKESKTGAYEAIDKADAANKILIALNSGNAITGPAANQRIALNQVGTMLGVTGSDNDKAVKSREIIQGLAQLTLAGRKGMKGQGAMDKMEGELANQVMSGKIDLTPAELAMLANGAKKSAKNQYKQHENMMQALRQDEPRSAKYFEVPVNPDIFEPMTAKAPTGTSQTVNDALSIIRGNKPGAQ